VKTKLALLAVPMVAGFWAVSEPVLADQAIYPNAPVTGEHQNVRNLFRLRCGGCHGGDGEGTSNTMPKLAPALKGNPLVINAPNVVLVNIIRKGRIGRQRLYHDSPFANMPGFGAEMVPNVDELVVFLKTDLQK
jgi:mono/diheme cytochrome c family protein